MPKRPQSSCRIIDANVISILAGEGTPGVSTEVVEFYLKETRGVKWYITPTIKKELLAMHKRHGKRDLRRRCFALLSARKAEVIEWSKEMEDRLDDEELGKHFPDKRKSDRRDKKMAISSLVTGHAIVAHDQGLYECSKAVHELVVISWYGVPRRRRRGVRRGRKGRK